MSKSPVSSKQFTFTSLNSASRQVQRVLFTPGQKVDYRNVRRRLIGRLRVVAGISLLEAKHKAEMIIQRAVERFAEWAGIRCEPTKLAVMQVLTCVFFAPAVKHAALAKHRTRKSESASSASLAHAMA